MKRHELHKMKQLPYQVLLDYADEALSDEEKTVLHDYFEGNPDDLLVAKGAKLFYDIEQTDRDGLETYLNTEVADVDFLFKKIEEKEEDISNHTSDKQSHRNQFGFGKRHFRLIHILSLVASVGCLIIGITINWPDLQNTFLLNIRDLSVSKPVGITSDLEFWQIGEERFYCYNSPSFLKQSLGSEGLKSYEYLSKVGGVGFEEVAKLDSNISGKKISISYNPLREDGQRLEVKIEDDRYTMNIPDWQLIPIGKYANSKYTACVTLFGANSFNKGYSRVYNIRYHSAFTNTLLGMRLLQADIFLINPEEFTDLPTKLDGQNYVIGEGEGNPIINPYEINQRKNTAFQIENLLFYSSIEDEYQSPLTRDSNLRNLNSYRSWLLTDNKQTIEAKIESDNLILEGEPYYYFWNYDRLNKEVYASENIIQKFKNNYALFGLANKEVFQATQNTMLFAALFRLVKGSNPENWEKFINDIESLDPLPMVKTPNYWNPKGIVTEKDMLFGVVL